MKTKLKNERGITLIALIITVIVLLILAGVTINLTIGQNGIFKTAKQAARDYTNAQDKEFADLNSFENTIAGIIGNGSEGSTQQPVTEITLNKTTTEIGIGKTATLTAIIKPDNAYNKNVTWSSSDNSIATVSNGTITGVSQGTVTITATAQDGSGKSASCSVTITEPLSTKAKPGDYVKYTPTAKSFTMTPAQTGQDANQDYNTGDYTDLWQVLYNDAEHGLQIISADIVGNLNLGNDYDEAKTKIGYNNAVNTLNSFCSNYVDTKYAIENSGRSVGSNPKSPSDATTATEKLQFTYNGSTESGCKIADENYVTDYNAMKAATNQNANGIHKLGKSYWLASRGVSSYSDCTYFDVRVVDSNGDASSSRLWIVNSYGYSDPFSNPNGVRPIVTLKSDIQVSKGVGSDTSPFELVAK